MSGAEEIAAEREKQRRKWGDGHDDQHRSGELRDAAILYAAPGLPAALVAAQLDDPRAAVRWRWSVGDDRRVFHDTRARLVVAGAFLAAEIDRMDRAVVYERHGRLAAEALALRDVFAVLAAAGGQA